MKNIAYSIIVLLLFSCSQSRVGKKLNDEGGKYPELLFDETIIDLGVFAKNDFLQTALFKYQNVGNDLLVIHSVISVCGCMVIEYDKKPVSPGDSGIIKVSYDGKRQHPTRFRKAITIYSNTEKRQHKLYVDGTLTP